MGLVTDNAVVVTNPSEWHNNVVNLNKGVRMDARDFLKLSKEEQEQFNKMAEGGRFGANRSMTYENAYRQAIFMGIDFNKPYNKQTSSDSNNLLMMYAMVGLADRSGWQKADEGGTGREFFNYLQKKYKKK